MDKEELDKAKEEAKNWQQRLAEEKKAREDELEEKRVQKTKELFQFLDADGDLHLSAKEMLRFSRLTGLPASDEEFEGYFREKLCKTLGCDPDRGMTEDEFTQFFERCYKVPEAGELESTLSVLKGEDCE